MNEPVGNNGAQTPDNSKRSRDGALELSGYSLPQLHDLLQVIDPATQPQNHSTLLAELARRAEASATFAADNGRFSERNGWLGWLDAKRRHSPVFGAGSLLLSGDHIALHGQQRTWLGIRVPGSVQLPRKGIRNVVVDGDCLNFELKRRLLPARRIRYRAASHIVARDIASNLPTAQSAGFAQGWEEIRAFQARVDSIGSHPWTVLALIALNIAMFVVLALANGGVGDFDPLLLMQWGANFGPATISDEWWRLITAQFLHANLVHLLANMWVLLNVGRPACRLYGNAAFLGVYFGAGLCGYIFSTAWNPANVSVGASGAIFGVIGAFFAIMLRQRAQIPGRVLRAHWPSTLVFVAYNLVAGGFDRAIDNAAHVGGLITGFMLGLLLARSLDLETRARWPIWQSIASAAIVASVGLAGFVQVHGITNPPNSIERFLRDNDWYVSGERENLAMWQQTATQLSMGFVSGAEVSRRFTSQIVPFWKDAHERLETMIVEHRESTTEFELLLRDYARTRRDWALAIVDATDDQDAQRGADAARLMQEADDVLAQIERLQLRAQMEYRPRALAHSLPVNRMRAWVRPRGWECVDSPPRAGRSLGDSDAPADAPVLRHEVGCLAQRYFHEGDYPALEALMRDAAARLNDLPDGNSSLDAIFGAISSLIFYGNNDLEALLGRTADWRRTVKEPLMADLVEAIVFQQWAWTARGQASASEVTAQSWYHFRHRVQMAAAALRAIEKSGQDLPVWHDLSLDVALDLSTDVDGIRAIFDRGIDRFPDYQPLYGSMLRVLMPRWLGSYKKVDQFIADVTHAYSADQDIAKYAYLYWTYFILEMDDCNIFTDGEASWTNLDLGFAELMTRYPRSDYLLNAYAVMACVARDRDRYGELRPRVEKRLSRSAWSEKYSIANCDREMRLPR